MSESDQETEERAEQAPPLQGDAAQDDAGRLDGFVPVAPKLSGPWSSYKNEILDRLEKARREDGVKLADIVQASDGRLTDKKILDVINRSRLPMAEWEALDAALAALGYSGPGKEPAPVNGTGGAGGASSAPTGKRGKG